MKAVIYARYSPGGNQTEQSIEGQLRECYDYAKNHDITIIDTYIDRSISGKTDDREQFQKMIRDSDRLIFEAVLLYKMDRFARNRYDSAIYKARLKKNGVKVLYAKENIPDGPEGIILESLLEGMAEYYSAELSQKIKRGMIENAHKCHTTGGPAPLGYKVAPDKTFVIDEEEAPIVQKMFTLYDQGVPIKDIHTMLNAMGLQTSTGSRFTKSSFHSIFKNQKYIGIYESQGIITEGGIPAIVDKDLFDRVQARMKSNRHAPARGKAKVKYLLSGKLYCGHCGAGMIGESGTSKTGAVHSYYTCANKKRFKTCKKKTVKKSWMEKLIVAETVRHILHPDKINAIAKKCIELQSKEVTEDNSLLLIKKQLSETKKAVSNLMTAIEQGIITKTTKARLAELEAAQESLELEIELHRLQPTLTEKQIIFMLSQFQRETTDDLEKYNEDIINCFVSAVYMYDDKLYITYNLTNEKSNLERLDLIELDNNSIHTISSSDMVHYGGGEENRTPVQRHCHKGFSERSLQF